MMQARISFLDEGVMHLLIVRTCLAPVTYGHTTIEVTNNN